MVMLPLWYSFCLGVSGAFFGYWYGRSRHWIKERAGEDVQPGTWEKCIISPAGGTIECFEQEGNAGVRISTVENKLFSPVSGRVARIAPRGNELLIQTDWGGMVSLRVCNVENDLMDRYFRPRVVRGEIVRKGKLLLEYDREELAEKCVDTAVYLSALNVEEDTLEVTGREWVGRGESLVWIRGFN